MKIILIWCMAIISCNLHPTGIDIMQIQNRKAVLTGKKFAVWEEAAEDTLEAGLSEERHSRSG